MILRLGLNEMDLQRSKQMLALIQRQPDQPRRVFGHGRATTNLMNANITRHFIPNSRLQKPGVPIAPPPSGRSHAYQEAVSLVLSTQP
jgi:hypothetical protein